MTNAVGTATDTNDARVRRNMDATEIVEEDAVDGVLWLMRLPERPFRIANKTAKAKYLTNLTNSLFPR